MIVVNRLVSVIIPHFNGILFLKETLQSVLNQDYSHLEIIVVDDHSDESQLNEFWNLNIIWPDIKLFKRPNNLPKGANSCRNFGFLMSSGEYINFIDSDDLILKEKISKQIKFFRDNRHLDVVVCKTFNFHGASSNIISSWQKENFYIDSDYLSLYLSNRALWCTNSALIRRSCFEKISFLEGQLYANEWLLFTRMMVNGYKIGGLNDYFVLRRTHSNSLGRISSSKKLKYFIEARLFIHESISNSLMESKEVYLNFLIHDLNSFLKSSAKYGLWVLFNSTLKKIKISWFLRIRALFIFLILFLLKKGDTFKVIK
ncbi:MAG: glycosyltransferase family 2 protein [Algoriphagus sp.]|uniref:glycosyltransferase family 2 protein n=1 Tax=Algoriphagus sp. TaxID=1872435 RepID=UPI002621BF21|nr:glycosyltransferase family 2 protein [Algoriphagus sp.]MDG1275700.1 glycosyltransferase family 2 protein [Algoriphagus sp.]